MTSNNERGSCSLNRSQENSSAPVWENKCPPTRCFTVENLVPESEKPSHDQSDVRFQVRDGRIYS